MKINIPSKVEVDIKTVAVHVKVCDSGSYDLRDVKGDIVGTIEQDYVPSFFPGEHYGDYLILNIDIETGQITNWKKPNPDKILDGFTLK